MSMWYWYEIYALGTILLTILAVSKWYPIWKIMNQLMHQIIATILLWPTAYYFRSYFLYQKEYDYWQNKFDKWFL